MRHLCLSTSVCCANRVSDAGGGQPEFSQVKSGEVQKDDFNTAVRNVGLVRRVKRDVTVICGHNIRSPCCAATRRKLSVDDLSSHSSETESVGFRKCPYYDCLKAKFHYAR